MLAAGRAAQRMGEIQGIEPCTIHRLLGYQPRRANGSGEPGGQGGGQRLMNGSGNRAGLPLALKLLPPPAPSAFC